MFVFRFLSSFLHIALAYWVWSNKRKSLNLSQIMFIAFSLASAIWLFVSGLFFIYYNLLYLRASFAFGSFVPALALIWILYFTKKNPSKILSYFIIIIGVIFFTLSLFSNTIISAITPINTTAYNVDNGILYIFYSIYLGASVAAIITLLLTTLNKSNGIFREQIKYIFFGALLFGGEGFITNAFLGSYIGLQPETAIDGFIALFFTFISAYAMIRYRFMDVRVIIKKGTIYGITLFLVVGIYMYLMFLVSRIVENFYAVNYQVTSIVSVILISLSFNPLKRSVDYIINQYFFKKTVNREAVILKIKQQLNSKKPLEDLVIEIRQELKDNINAKYVDLIIPNYLPNGEWAIPNQELKLIEKMITKRSLFSLYFLKYNDIIVTEEIPFKIEEIENKEEKEILNKVYIICKDLKIGILAPIKTTELIGILTIGEKNKGEIYTIDDIDYINNLNDNLISTLSASLLYYKAIERIKMITRK